MTSGRIALVTGSAQGIGRAIAHSLATDGYDVAINDIASQRDAMESTVSEVLSLGRRSIAIVADVSNEDDVKSMIDTVARELGGLDVVSVSSPCFMFKH